MVTEIEACPHMVFRKLPNIDFFSFILLRANQAEMYCLVYISIMIKHLRIILFVFWVENRNRLSEYEFYSWAVWPIFYPKKNSDQYFKFTSIFKLFLFSAAISLRFLKDQRVYLHTCSFQPAFKWLFGGAEDLFYHVRTNVSRHVENSLSDILSPYDHVVLQMLTVMICSHHHRHNPLVFTDESKPTCVYISLGLKAKESDSRKKMI